MTFTTSSIAKVQVLRPEEELAQIRKQIAKKHGSKYNQKEKEPEKGQFQHLVRSKRFRKNDPAQPLHNVLTTVQELKQYLLDWGNDLGSTDVSDIILGFGKIKGEHAEISEALKEIGKLTLKRKGVLSADSASQFIWLLGKYSTQQDIQKELMLSIKDELIKSHGNLSPLQLDKLFYGMAKLGIYDLQLLTKLSFTIKKQMNVFHPRTLGTITWGLGKLKHGDKELMAALSFKIIEKIQEFKPQGIALIAWSFANQSIYDRQLMSAICNFSVENLNGFNPRDLANVLWACGKLYHIDSVFLQSAADVIIKKVGGFHHQDLANTIWTYASLQVHNQDLQKSICKQSVKTLQHFQPQSFSSLIWSLSALGHNDENVLNYLGNQAAKNLRQFSSQGVANVAWAFANLGLDHEPLFERINQEFQRYIQSEQANQLDVVNIIWSLAKLGRKDLDLLNKASDWLQKHVHSLSAQNVSNVMWSYATMRYVDSKLFDKLNDRLVENIEYANSQDLANAAWANANLTHYNDSFLQGLSEKFHSRLDTFLPQHVAMISWAYGVLGASSHLNPRLWFSNQVVEKLTRSTNQQNMTNLMWSMAVASFWDKEVWQKCVEYINGIKVHLFQWDQFGQLYHCVLLREAEGQSPLQLNRALMEAIFIVWKKQRKKSTISEFQKQVLRIVKQLGFNQIEVEYLSDDGALMIDIALVKERIAIEVDGEHHFTSNPPHGLLGRTVARNRILQHKGWKLVSIPQFEWKKCRDLQHLEFQLVQKKIKEVAGCDINGGAIFVGQGDG